MGNSPSKSRKSDNLLAAFPRSDTQGSSRSTRSIRSRRSNLSERSDRSIGKNGAADGSPVENINGVNSATANITSSAGGTSTNNSAPGHGQSQQGPLAADSVDTRSISRPNSTYGGEPLTAASHDSSAAAQADSSGYPFPLVNNANLPPSLQQWEPMEPILLHRDRDGNLTTPSTGPGQAQTPGQEQPQVQSQQPSSGPNASISPLTPTSTSFPGRKNSSGSNKESDRSRSRSPLRAQKEGLPELHRTDHSSADILHDDAKDEEHASPRSPTGSIGVSHGAGGISINSNSNGSNNHSAANASNASLTNSYYGSSLSAPNTPINMPSGASTPRNAPPILTSQHSPGGYLNIDEVIQRLLDAGYSGKTTRSVCLKNSEIVVICQTAREIFLSQPTLLELTTPVKIVGDVHGQYGDLIRLFDMCGFPPAANYLFLGDYVDRGKQSLETILLLLCYKIKYPENFFLLRGNHECANVTRVYGFYDECKRRCNIKTWKTFVDTFNSLPIAAVVARKIFCVHGGLSPSLNSMNEIRNIERPTDVPDYGLLNDLLWSDPADANNEWEDNERGVSYCFNQVAINKFLAKFGFELVCRAHMVVEDGYEFFNDQSLVTVFSAPNYCGEFDNWGAVMSVSEDLLCTFELLKPLDSVALKQVMRKGKTERRNSMITNQQQQQSGGGPQSV